MSTFNDLGNQTKTAEAQWKRKLPQHSYVLLRLDGKAFHSYTKGLEQPFDLRLMSAMNQTMLELCRQIQGVQAGYTQSDEITILFTDFKKSASQEIASYQEYWMGGVVEKILTLSASIATAQFNKSIIKNISNSSDKYSQAENEIINFDRVGVFDSRLMVFESTEEGRQKALDAFRWRWIDAKKNAVNMAAHYAFGHKKLLGVSTEEKKYALESIAGIAPSSSDDLSENIQSLLDVCDNDNSRRASCSWVNAPDGFKYGRLAVREERVEDVLFVDKRDNQIKSDIVTRYPFVIRDAVEDVFFSRLEKKIPMSLRA